MSPRIALSPVDRPADDEAIIAFLAGNAFPFHGVAHPTRDQAEAAIAAGRYDGPDRLPFWILADGKRIGMATLEDIRDPTALLDLRLAEGARGRGFGTEVLRLLAHEGFRGFAGIHRVEGQTREDNIAMRRAFRRAGWVKEAHHREAWPDTTGRRLAAVSYAILRSDWSTGGTTSVPWEDEPGD